MGTIRRIKNKSGVVWRVEVHVCGVRDSKRLQSKPEAVEWMLIREAELERRSGIDKGRTVNDALLRYANEVSPKKKGARWEKVRLKKFQRDPIANIPLLDLTLEDAEDFRDRSLARISNGSVIRELNLLKTVIRKTFKWKWVLAYPWDGLEMPESPRARDKLLTDDEIQAMSEGFNVSNDELIETAMQQVGIMFLLSLQTAMRLGEVCKLEWSNVDLKKQTAHLPDTKNGDPRDVPLSSRAVELIKRMPQERKTVFNVDSETASTLFRRVRRRLELKGFTYHDSRHRAITDLAEKLDPYELCRVAGWRDLKMAMVYYNKSASDIAKMLD